MNENKTTIFFDSVGRTIIGEKVQEETNDNILTVKNPAVIHIIPNQQTGQLQLQILPLFFKEFLAEKEAGSVWKYNRSSITESVNLVLDFKLEAQYQQIFTSTPKPAPSQPQGSQEVIKLFDE